MAWDGTGSPGDGNPTVDSLSGPEYQRAFGFAGPTIFTYDQAAKEAEMRAWFDSLLKSVSLGS
jgi:hypothetical protein